MVLCDGYFFSLMCMVFVGGKTGLQDFQEGVPLKNFCVEIDMQSLTFSIFMFNTYFQITVCVRLHSISHDCFVL